MRQLNTRLVSRLAKKLVLLAAFSVLLSACSEDKQRGHYVGYIEENWVYVSSPQPGLLESVLVKEGDLISAGQILVELEQSQQLAKRDQADSAAEQAQALALDSQIGPRPSELKSLEANLRQAQANLKSIAAERKRIVSLVKKGLEAQSRGDQIQANYAAAKSATVSATQAILTANSGSRINQQKALMAAAQAARSAAKIAQAQLDERSVQSTLDGRIEEVFFDAGEFVTSGAALVAISPANALIVRFFVPQNQLSKISKGAAVLVHADSLQGPIPAVISYISTQAEFTPPVIYSAKSRDKLVFLVEATLAAKVQQSLQDNQPASDSKPMDNGEALPGLPVDVELR